jgi:LysR family transcriptional regulator, transcription activator of glutamate synthase operon
VLPITHLLAGEKLIPLRMLANENFLLELPDTMPYRLSIKACELSGFEPRVAITNIDREYLIDLVSKGMGVALLLKELVLHLSYPKIAIIEITPTVSTQIDLCYLKGVELSEVAKHFIFCTGSQKN